MCVCCTIFFLFCSQTTQKINFSVVSSPLTSAFIAHARQKRFLCDVTQIPFRHWLKCIRASSHLPSYQFDVFDAQYSQEVGIAAVTVAAASTSPAFGGNTRENKYSIDKIFGVFHFALCGAFALISFCHFYRSINVSVFRVFLFVR